MKAFGEITQKGERNNCHIYLPPQCPLFPLPPPAAPVFPHYWKTSSKVNSSHQNIFISMSWLWLFHINTSVFISYKYICVYFIKMYLCWPQDQNFFHFSTTLPTPGWTHPQHKEKKRYLDFQRDFLSQSPKLIRREGISCSKHTNSLYFCFMTLYHHIIKCLLLDMTLCHCLKLNPPQRK